MGYDPFRYSKSFVGDNEADTDTEGRRLTRRSKSSQIGDTDGRLVTQVKQGNHRTASGTRVVTGGKKKKKGKKNKKAKKALKKAQKQFVKALQKRQMAAITEKAARDSALVRMVNTRRSLQNDNVALQRQLLTTNDSDIRKGCRERMDENNARIDEITKALWSDAGKSADGDRLVGELTGLLVERKRLEAKVDQATQRWNQTNEIELHKAYGDQRRTLLAEMGAVDQKIALVKARMAAV